MSDVGKEASRVTFINHQISDNGSSSARFPGKVQGADVHQVDVPEAVARAVNLLRELRIGQPGLQRLISEASFTGEEKILPIRRDDGAKIECAGIDLWPKIDSFRPHSIPPEADIKIAVSVAFGTSVRDKDEETFIRRDIGITFRIL